MIDHPELPCIATFRDQWTFGRGINGSETIFNKGDSVEVIWAAEDDSGFSIRSPKLQSNSPYPNGVWFVPKIALSFGSIQTEPDPVNHPTHYTSHPSNVECITITRHFNFNLGNVIKYLWRAPLKGATLEDLKKARWYLDDEITQIEQREAAK